MKRRFPAFASILLFNLARPAVGAEPIAGEALESYWEELAEASVKQLRERAIHDGFAVNRVECRLLLGDEPWKCGPPLKERTRFLVTRIGEAGLPQHTGLEYRGYLYRAEAGVIGATVSARGNVSLEIDGEPVVAYLSREAQLVRTEYLELAEGHHPIQVQFASHLPGGALDVSFGTADDARFRFQLDLAGPPPEGDGRGPGDHEWDPGGRWLSPPGRLAALAEWLRGVFLSPGMEDEVAAALSQSRSQFLPEANPYLLFLEQMGPRLKRLTDVRVAEPEPATTGGLIARASGEQAFLLLTADRPAPPQVLPVVLLEMDFPSGERLSFPRASKLRLAGNRARILPVGMAFGALELVYSTAQPLAVLEDATSRYLVALGEEGGQVEYAFPHSDVKSLDIPSWMGDLYVKHAPRTIVAPADGRGHFRVRPLSGRDLIVKTISFSAAQNAAVWDFGHMLVLVMSNMTPLGHEGDEMVVQLAPRGHERVRLFPGSTIRGMECEGEMFAAEHWDDWAEIRFAPSPPPLVAKRVAPDRVEFILARLDPSVMDVCLKVRYRGKRARAYAGDRLIAQSEDTAHSWRFSVLEALQAGERAIRFEFEPSGGSLATVNVEPVVRKKLKLRVASGDTD